MIMQAKSSPLIADDGGPFPIRFPADGLDRDQDGEFCEVYLSRRWRRIRLHDYATIFEIPGLYERLFCDVLRCKSPARVVRLLGEVLRDASVAAANLSVVDVGAGNGLVGEELRRLCVRNIVGVDILPEARHAALRDRPGIYDDYVVADLEELSDSDRSRLTAHAPDCLTTVAALGFGDMPPAAFAAAFNLIRTPGWIAFNIKDAFLRGIDSSGFARLIRIMCDREVLQMQAYRRYQHRLSTRMRGIHYVAMVARKLRDIPPAMLAEAQEEGADRSL